MSETEADPVSEARPLAALVEGYEDVIRRRSGQQLDEPALRLPDGVSPEDQRAALLELRAETWWARMPRKFHDAHVEDFAEPVRGHLAEWPAMRPPRNLLLFGPVGTGKTHAAVAAVRALHDRGRRVEFWPIVELLDRLKRGFDTPGPDDELPRLAALDVLLIDDLGSERVTDWTAERLFALVNRRWLEERPTVATTNLDPREGGSLMEVLTERTWSRLVGGSLALRIAGNDRRRGRNDG